MPGRAGKPDGAFKLSVRFISTSFVTLEGINLLVGLGGVGSAAPTLLDQIKSAGVLKVGTEGTYAPFTFHNDSNALTGFDVEIARAIAWRLGVKA
jgi:ABC-type amino acid transport substrate-binding protein